MTRISLKGSDTTWQCDDDTIMRSALRAGYGFPYECNVGSCGNCRFEVIEGEVEHLRQDPPGLNERDRAKGRALGCQARPLTDCVIKVRFAPQYESVHRPVRQAAVLTEVLDITHDIREFRLELEDAMEFLPGQYALLSVPGVEGARAYSMSNVAGDDKQWHFQIRRVPGGEATTALFDNIAVGDAIAVDGPYGMAYLRPEAPRDILLIAGGSGLAPMVSIARAASRTASLAGRRIDFVYGGRMARDICGESFLQELEGYGDRIGFHPAVSSPEEENWNGYRGFIHELVIEKFGDRLAQTEIYFAGPPAMGDALQRLFLEKGVPQDQIHYDQFF